MRLRILAVAFLWACSSEPLVDDGGGLAHPDAAPAAADARPIPSDAAVIADDAAVIADDAAVVAADSGGADSGALLPYGARCAVSAECETMLCDRVEMRNICTAMCMNGVCPLPNSSCNNRGLCRPN